MRSISFSILSIALIGCSNAEDATVLSNATIIDGKGGVVENGVVIVKDDRIACVGATDDCPAPKGAETHDLSGRYITPGIVDAHVHFGQTGWIDGRPDGIDAPEVYPYEETFNAFQADPGRWHRAYLCSGVTAVFDVGGAKWTVTEEHATDTDRADRVHVRAAGPLITHGHARNRFYTRGAQADQLKFLPFDSDDAVRAHVAHLKEIGSAAVKVWFLRVPEDRLEELDGRLMLVGELAREAGLPLIVHATGLREAKAALNAGAKMLVHSVDDVPVDDEFIEKLLANDTVYAPTLVVSKGWTQAMSSVALKEAVDVDDPNHCADEAILDRIAHPERLSEALGDRISPEQARANLIRADEKMALLGENLRAVRDAGGHIVVATDAGNPLTVHGPSINWEMEAMQEAGMTPEEIIEAATIKAAQAMAMEDEIGTLETGKIADLIILAEDPREDVTHFRSLTHVMRKGVLKTQKDLQVR